MATNSDEKRETLLFVFSNNSKDYEGHGSRSPESVAINNGPHIRSKVRRCCCNKCVICLLVLLGIILAAIGILAVVVSQKLDFGSKNVEVVSEEMDALYNSWEAPGEIKEKARTYFGVDKENRTIWFIDFGSWDLETLLQENATLQDLNMYIDQSFHRIWKNVANQLGHNNTTGGWALVVNLHGYGLAQAFDTTAIGFLQDMTKRHLPSLASVDYAIVINVAYWARFLSSIMKPLMGNVLDKFDLFGYDDWLPTMLERIPKDQLPPGYDSYFTEE